MTKHFIEPLSFTIHESGAIDLVQDVGSGENHQIHLHPMHVRILFEETGHLLPNPPANEMLKNLVRGLLAIRESIKKANAQRYSPDLARLCDQADIYCAALPKHLVQDAKSVSSVDMTTSNEQRPDFELKTQSAKGEGHD